MVQQLAAADRGPDNPASPSPGCTGELALTGPLLLARSELLLRSGLLRYGYL